ncbi:ubiquinone/menaquinone biosynthesis C-methylase UbiE [Cytobacillus eiseniae]|uniref:Ubiquinone/menaquinone biosynthesis C-methylase UbiE n=1 Tax=Cytobacillus eiseniae TaxID=762947 RepID=A0ABS4RBU4_9BACI|nr:class I SAM-dependent methyltransferase [Cytobacillus eiseniae]MBP2239861.1 ubiquinone/menaquinone biosynthesis C-methylase UbiE [Cytobacillus eiseniae]
MSSITQTDYDKMPGHWVLAKMGKRVLRPGGIELTKKMLEHLHITADDEVAEFAPGLGATAKFVLDMKPKSYTAIEQNEEAAKQVRKYLPSDNAQCIIGHAQNTNLPDQSVDALYGEAMLTMQSPKQKEEIIEEAHRILRNGGRYGIHELCLTPNEIDDELKSVIQKDLAKVIRVNAKPLTVFEWKSLFEQKGFSVVIIEMRPMHLLEKKRMIQDEGVKGFASIVKNIAVNPDARKRIEDMHSTFKKYEKYLGAISIIMEKQQ